MQSRMGQGYCYTHPNTLPCIVESANALKRGWVIPSLVSLVTVTGTDYWKNPPFYTSMDVFYFLSNRRVDRIDSNCSRRAKKVSALAFSAIATHWSFRTTI